ncbi:MAG: hypothetical protein Q7R39_09895 [Dehalococcoidia bacterium]|nr:hypothetical protein [Dehalococcoidia bacterium]
MSTKNPLIALGYVLLGVGYLYESQRKQPGTGAVAGGAPRRAQLGLGEGNRRYGVGDVGEVIKTGKVSGVRNIDQRLAYIIKLMQDGSISPIIKEKAAAVLTKKCGSKWCVTPQDYLAEIGAMFEALKDPRSDIALRYTRDHVTVDQFMTAENLMRINAGDCDDGVVLLGALLMSIGYPVKCRVVQAKGATTWSHVYLLVGTPPTDPTKWIALDWSVTNSTVGWEAPGAKQCAKTGQPSRVIMKVRDFDVPPVTMPGA